MKIQCVSVTRVNISKKVSNVTLHRGPTIQTKMSLARTYCTINLPLSCAMEDCSIVRVQHLSVCVCVNDCVVSTSLSLVPGYDDLLAIVLCLTRMF